MLLSSTKFLCRYVHFLGDYRKRFGIESSYRQKDLYRICISTKNPVTRFPYVGIASTVCNTLNCFDTSSTVPCHFENTAAVDYGLAILNSVVPGFGDDFRVFPKFPLTLARWSIPFSRILFATISIYIVLLVETLA